MLVFEAGAHQCWSATLILARSGAAFVLWCFGEFLKLFAKAQELRVALRQGRNGTVWQLPIRAARLAKNLISMIFLHRQWIARP
jgi:hypothetical protein